VWLAPSPGCTSTPSFLLPSGDREKYLPEDVKDESINRKREEKIFGGVDQTFRPQMVIRERSRRWHSRRRYSFFELLKTEIEPPLFIEGLNRLRLCFLSLFLAWAWYGECVLFPGANYTRGPTTCTLCEGLVLKSKVRGIVVPQLTNMWRFSPQSTRRWHVAL
jgi:hypothetical protein